MALFEIKDVDRRFYRQRLADFLPDEFIDFHAHVWLQGLKNGDRDAMDRIQGWPYRVAVDDSIEDLFESYELMFPGKKVTPQIFSSAEMGDDLDALNAYVRASAREHNVPSLLYTTPEWSAEPLERKLADGGFIGVKPYVTLAPAYIPAPEIRVFDYLPHHHLDVLDRRRSIVILHLPRAGRLKDPVNLAQMLEIEQRYPNLQLVVAHVGRAYCVEDLGDAFDVLAPTERMRFCITANTNAEVFRRTIQAVGPGRIVFGSDLPITRMRMRRVCADGVYVNIVPRGLYGDVSGDQHMREVDPPEADELSFFLYEEIDAFRRAAQAEGLSDADVAAVFRDNAAAMFEAAGWTGSAK